MKRPGSLIACLFLAAGLAPGQTRGQIRILPDVQKYLSIGIQGGAFFGQDAELQEIYGKSLSFFGPEVALRLPVSDPHGLELAVGGRFLKADGKTSYMQEATRLRLTTLSAALQYSFDNGGFAFSLGPAVDYLMYKETYAATFPVPFTSGNTVGLGVQGAVLIHLTSGLSAKGYGKYCQASTEDPGFRVNLGGSEWGAGLVYRFHF